MVAKARGLALAAGLLTLCVGAYAQPAGEQPAPPAAEVTLRGNAMNNAHTGERERAAFLYALDGTGEVRAEVEKIVADYYPDSASPPDSIGTASQSQGRGLDADAAVKLQDQFTRRLKYFVAGPLTDEIYKKLSYGSVALALTGTVEEKDGRRWIRVSAYRDAQLAFPAKMLAPDRPFEMPGEPLILKISDTLSLKCIRVPAGRFLMGAPYYQYPRWQEDPPHVVTLTKPFYMAEHPVTQEIYEQVCGANPSTIRNPKMPVHRVDCASMYDFCRRLSQKSGRKVRIPTAAEWEFAARVGTSNPTFAERYKAQSSNANAKWLSEPRTVKSKAPNAWGFYDMHSGGWERVADTNARLDRVDVTDPAHIPPEDSGGADPKRPHGHFGKGHWSYPISEPEYITSEATDERGFTRFRVVVEVENR